MPFRSSEDGCGLDLHADYPQVDGNILYPRIVGGVMKVHPITIMVLLLLSSNIYGVLGMIVAIPTYSILKEIAKFLANLYDNHKEAQAKKNESLGLLIIRMSLVID